MISIPISMRAEVLLEVLRFKSSLMLDNRVTEACVIDLLVQKWLTDDKPSSHLELMEACKFISSKVDIVFNCKDELGLFAAKQKRIVTDVFDQFISPMLLMRITEDTSLDDELNIRRIWDDFRLAVQGDPVLKQKLEDYKNKHKESNSERCEGRNAAPGE